jgi:hypothetical protein
VQRTFRQEFDPGYEGLEENYDYARRPQPVQKAVQKVSLTGDIKKPLITLHGSLDALLPITNSDKYAKLIEEKTVRDLHRYYKIDGGTHVDALYDHAGFREKLRPILPCYRAAFKALEKWVEDEKPPPKIETVPKPSPDEGVDIVNACPTLGYDGSAQT